MANRAGRQLVLIDIENMVGAPLPTEEQVVDVTGRISAVCSNFDNAIRVVACSHLAAQIVRFAIPFGLHRWRSGRNGADLELLDVLENNRVDERFEAVILCSGDGIFADAVSELAGRGVDVTVVAVRGHLSKRLRLAANRIVYLEAPSDMTPTGKVG